MSVIIVLAALIVSCTGNPASRIVAVAPVKMNVFYLGVDNPLTIAVSGVNNADITTSTDNGTIEKRGEFYIAKPQKAGLATVSVFVRGKLAGAPQFRVKNLPDPVAMIAGLSGGTIDKLKLLNAAELNAVIVGSDFEAPFKVVSFTVSVTKKGFVFEKTANGQNFTQAQKELIQSLDAGKRVYFQDIKAVGPDGQERKLSTIDFHLQ